MISISPLSGIAATGSSTSDSAGKGKQYHPRQGQIFKAIVVEGKSANTFILDIGGKHLTAQTKIPLTVGHTLKLEVAATSPQVELRILADSADLFFGKTITLLGNKIDIQTLFDSLRSNNPTALSLLNPQSRQTLDTYFNFNQESLVGKNGGNLLKNLIDRLGISLESLLVNSNKDKAQISLKAALLNLAQLFKSADKLAETTTTLLNTIELYQLAQLKLDSENIFIFPLPVPFLEKGYLIVEKDAGNANEHDNEQNFSLHLALQGLGNLRIDLQKNDNGISIRFVSDSQEKLDFIKQFKDDLLLAMINTNIVGIAFSLDHVDPSADLMKKLLPDGTSIVNTTA